MYKLQTKAAKLIEKITGYTKNPLKNRKKNTPRQSSSAKQSVKEFEQSYYYKLQATT